MGYNFYLNSLDSYYMININNVVSINGYAGLYAAFRGLSTNSNCRLANATSMHIVITRSVFSNNMRYGMVLNFFESNFPIDQVIVLKSCLIFNNSERDGVGFGVFRHTLFQSPSIRIENTKLVSNTFNIAINVVMNLTNVTVSNSLSTGFKVINSVLYINGSFTLQNNAGQNGGGLLLAESSQLRLHPNTFVLFIGNHAHRGGGLFSNSILSRCPIEVVSNNTNITVWFVNNNATSGTDVFGTDIDYYCKALNIFNSNVIQTTEPVKVCFCTDDICSLTSPAMQSVFPGQKVNFFVALWGFGYNTTYTITDGSLMLRINADTHVQAIEPRCFHVSYQPNTPAQNQRYDLVLTITKTIPLISVQPLTVPFFVLPCPIGFQFSSKQRKCVCSAIISSTNDTKCDIETLKITRSGLTWIGPYNAVISDAHVPIAQNMCLIEEHCLFCNPANISFLLNDTDLQCQQNRSGTLCRSCRAGFSLVLSTNECKECADDNNIALIIPFALVGIALVVFLIVLNLTVSVGTLYGLLFTANIIKLYKPVFVGDQTTAPFFSQIVSWLNLDFGIEVCFYSSMDKYAKTWFQFAFPFYMWIIIIVIIIVCQKSIRISKLIGSNVVPVLATLLLLSYTKLLYTVITVLSKQTLKLKCAENKSVSLTVWYGNPNLQYGQDKHLYLLLFSLLVLVAFCIPYTLFLLCNTFFEKYLSKYKLCSFCNKIKPVLDAHNGPMKDKYRFWPGLLLVARLPVLLTVTLVNDVIESRSLLLFVLLLVLVFLFSLAYCFGGVYSNPVVNVIEAWFLLIPSAMVASAIITREVKYYNIAIGLFVVSFIGVMAYHFYLKIHKRKWYMETLNKIIERFSKHKKQENKEVLSRTVTKEHSFIEISTPYDFEVECNYSRHDDVTELF